MNKLLAEANFGFAEKLCPKFYAGTRLVIPLNPFREYIEALAREEPPQPTASELRERVRE